MGMFGVVRSDKGWIVVPCESARAGMEAARAAGEEWSAAHYRQEVAEALAAHLNAHIPPATPAAKPPPTKGGS